MDFILSVGPFVSGGLARVVHSDNLLLFNEFSDVAVGSGNAKSRNLRGGKFVDFHGGKGPTGRLHHLFNHITLLGSSTHSKKS